MRTFSAEKAIQELLDYIKVISAKGIEPTITLEYKTLTEMRVRLNMLFAYISALKERKKR